jgi:hypothetical protein
MKKWGSENYIFLNVNRTNDIPFSGRNNIIVSVLTTTLEIL